MNRGRTSQVTRRKFLTSASIGAGALWLTPPILFAQNGNPVTVSRNQGAAAKIIVQDLRGGVSVLSGSGGNIAVLSGADGKILVDAGLATSRRAIAEALAGLDANPVRHLIDTHWHYDHTDGNEWLNSAGARIIAQDLRGGVSVLSGSGGNIAVLSGADGKILVDAGLATSRRAIAEALAGLDANPVRHLIDTHWHYDHTDGNEWLNSAGARIIAQ